MTDALATLFEGTPIQVVNESGEFWFPLPDLTGAWGVSKDTLSHQIERNKDLFAGMSGEKYVTYPTGGVQETCVNERGLYTLIGRLNTDRLKNPHAKEAILRFQRWVPELIQNYRKHEIVSVEQKDIDTLVQQHLHIADAMAQFAHVDRGIAVSVALARVEYDTGADLTCYKNLIRKDRQQAPGYLTPTQIGQELGGLSARTINQMLQQLGYQNYLGDRWQPTKVGENYGENMPFAVSLKNGGVHSDYQLKWSRNIVDTLRSQINGTRQIMDALK